MSFLLCVLLVVFIFEYINGFHDAANAIATVVATRVLTPRTAVLMAAVFNLAGALSGEAVAKTIGAGLIESASVTTLTIFAAMLAGIGWNLLTWWWGLPSSSSHALIGGLCGAALASAGDDWHVIKWSVETRDIATGELIRDGLFHKVIVPMITSPLAGLVGGFLLMALLVLMVRAWSPVRVNQLFGKLQLLSAAYMGWGHGFADAQKTMGVIALATFAATNAGELENLPPTLRFLYTPKFEIALWIKISCAMVMAAGTWAGGWRIIRTLGHKLVTLKPVHGFAAEATGATVLLVSGNLGLPVSTTHVITTAVMGVGLAKRPASLDTRIVQRIVGAWILTIPTTAFLAYWLYRLLAVAKIE